MTMAEAFAAIEARKQGVWDHPALVAIGGLNVDEDYDIETIQRKFLDDCGFVCGDRDPWINPDFKGKYMVVEEIGDADSWAIVGDDMRALIREAFEYADFAGYGE